MDWETYKTDWPNSAWSNFVSAGKHRWHLQIKGTGRCILLLHGTGASVHSWSSLFDHLSQDFKVVAIDLPGHGFTKLGTKQRSSLTHMSADIVALCNQEGIKPDYIIGHSAGTAVALEMSKTLTLRGVIGLNSALSKFGGIASWAFPMLAKVIALNPLIPSYLASLGSNPHRVKKLLNDTGSRLSEAQINFYKALFKDKSHVEGALLMMSQWNLDRLLLRLSELSTATLLIAGEKDRTVPPQIASQMAHTLPNGEFQILAGLGHLAHEEDPEQILDIITAFTIKKEKLRQSKNEHKNGFK